MTLGRDYGRASDSGDTAAAALISPASNSDREDDGMHSLRRTKAALIYKQTGNFRAVQSLLGHTKIESTVRDLGVDVEDALTLAERTEI